MPWTLYRYILKDLVKLLVMSTGVLLSVISFAAAIKPLADGLLDPAVVPKFIFYLMPTMLPLVLPFAGAFTCTLVFCRLAADNEILACSASGISYWRVLMPIYVLGAVLMVVLFALSNWMVPHFFRQAELLVQEDATQLVVQQLQQGRPVTFGKYVLYADRAASLEPTPEFVKQLNSDVPPFRVIIAERVALGPVDKEGRIGADLTAESANVLLFRDRGQTAATVRLTNAVAYDPATERLGRVSEISFPAVRLPSPFTDDPRFLSREELLELNEKPLKYDRVRVVWERLCDQAAIEVLRRRVTQKLEQSPERRVQLRGSTDQDIYDLKAPGVEVTDHGVRLIASPQSPIELDYFTQGLLTRHIEAKGGRITFESGAPSPEPRAHIELTGAKVTHAQVVGSPAEHRELHIEPLAWPTAVLEPIRTMPMNEMVQQARTEYGDASAVVKQLDSLNRQRTRLQRLIISQTHERAALAVTCMLSLMLAAVLAMRMRGAMPLVVFLVGFLVSLLAVIVTRTGENTLTNADNPVFAGILVSWSGVIILAIATGVTYHKLAKH